ncbi:MAG: restriction endonuclease subunit S [Oscillospiraceae bacterium]|jgi:type I restriction enzyme S subunit|nr:restriction endonuclease subunit S [Oscillospiraceae bacterium]
MTQKLSDVIDLIGGGTPQTSVAEYWGGDIPWLSVKDFNDDSRYVYSTKKTITETGLANSSTKLLDVDDIIISARGTVGELAMIPFPMAFNQSCYGIRGKKGKIVQTYLYYLLKNSIRLLKSQTHGSVFDTITRDTFANINVDLPPLAKQQTIADTLSVLDDKIANNSKINHHLEQMAQAIFKSWFVDSVPGHWDYVDLGTVTTEIRTKVKKQQLPVLSAVKTGNLVLSEDYFTKQVYSRDIGKYFVVEPNDFAYNPARVNIGSIGINAFAFSGCVSPVYAVFRAEPEYHHFLSFFLKSPNFQEEVRVRASGSVRQSLNYNDFAVIQVLYPSVNVIRKFNFQYDSILETQHRLNEENVRLAEIRDALLPRLMSGELSVDGLGDVNNGLSHSPLSKAIPCLCDLF